MGRSLLQRGPIMSTFNLRYALLVQSDEAGQIRAYNLLWIVSAEVRKVDLGVDTDKIRQYKPGTVIPDSKLPMIQAERLIVQFAEDGGERWYDPPTTLVIDQIDWSVVAELHRDSSKYIVQSGALVPNPNWIEGVYVVPEFDPPAGIQRNGRK